MNRYLKLTNWLISYFDDVRLEQVLQEESSKVDEVAKLASSSGATKNPGLCMEVQMVLSIEELHIFQAQSMKTWMDPILSYIRDSQPPLDLSEARKIKVRSSRFIVMNDKFYKKGFSLPYLKCISLEEEMYVLQEFHEGECAPNDF